MCKFIVRATGRRNLLSREEITRDVVRFWQLRVFTGTSSRMGTIFLRKAVLPRKNIRALVKREITGRSRSKKGNQTTSPSTFDLSKPRKRVVSRECDPIRRQIWLPSPPTMVKRRSKRRGWMDFPRTERWGGRGVDRWLERGNTGRKSARRRLISRLTEPVVRRWRTNIAIGRRPDNGLSARGHNVSPAVTAAAMNHLAATFSPWRTSV